ncbi:MAG: hypothetical protein WC890_07335 [Candidatus Margulisiibacteriota bacterium]
MMRNVAICLLIFFFAFVSQNIGDARTRRVVSKKSVKAKTETKTKKQADIPKAVIKYPVVTEPTNVKKPFAAYLKQNEVAPLPIAFFVAVPLFPQPSNALSITTHEGDDESVSSVDAAIIETASMEMSGSVSQESILVETGGQAKEDEPAICEMGAVGGIFCGAAALNAEIRFPLKQVFGPTTTSLRLLFGMAQSNDQLTRYFPLQVDYIFNFAPGYLSAVENYVGMGLSYAGGVGGQAFYGVQSDGFTGKLFGEFGYGLLNSGLSSTSHNGVTVLLGYRKDWPLWKKTK